MSDIEIVKQRVKKLLALSKSPNECEAISALRKANELMAEHNLTKAEAAGYVEKSVKSTKRTVRWRAMLANSVERLYATFHYTDTTGKCIFIGEELDAFMSAEMFAYLVKTVERMAAQNIRKNAKYRYRQSYREGVASRIYDRMYALGQQCSWRNPKELEQKKNEVAEWVTRQVSIAEKRARKGKTNGTAFARGQKDGDGVSLSRQMSGNEVRRIEGSS